MTDYFEKPIFILGLPRTGTSMIAGAFETCGVWAGSTVPGGTPVNPKGFFEHTVIREQIIKRILASMGCDPLGVRKLPPVDLQGDIPGLADNIKKVIEADGYKHKKPWLLKDVKLTLIWPIFLAAFPEAAWVIVRRDIEGFINSCLRTDFMQQHSMDRDFWRQLANEYNTRLDQLTASKANTYEISTPEIIGGDFSQLKNLMQSLGLEYKEKKLKKFISPSYWHGSTK